MVKVLLPGCNGLLGRKIAIKTSGKFYVLGIDLDQDCTTENKSFEYQKLDLIKAENVKNIVNDFKPDYIINASGYNNVDKCESEKEKCWNANVNIVKNLARYGRKINSKFIQFSTDFIFDGKKGNYKETDRPNPLSYYGRSKLASENNVIASQIEFSIIRTSTLFDYDRHLKKDNFATFVIKNLKARKKIRVVTDQTTNPTLVSSLADFVWMLVKLEKNDVYNFAGKDSVTRFEFAKKLAQHFDLNENLLMPIKTKELGQAATRPKNSSLNTEKIVTEIGFKPLTLDESITHLKNKMEIP